MTRVSLVVAPSLCPESAAEAFLLVLRLSLVDGCGAVSSAPMTSPSQVVSVLGAAGQSPKSGMSYTGKCP